MKNPICISTTMNKTLKSLTLDQKTKLNELLSHYKVGYFIYSNVIARIVSDRSKASDIMEYLEHKDYVRCSGYLMCPECGYTTDEYEVNKEYSKVKCPACEEILNFSENVEINFRVLRTIKNIF